MTQVYHTGEEVRLGDHVRCKDDDGIIVGLAVDLPKWGLSRDNAKGMVMIDYKTMKLVCEDTEANEDLEFVARSGV